MRFINPLLALPGSLRWQVKRLLEVAANHGSALRDAADQLAYLWGELEDAKAPAYDVATALHVLETGGWRSGRGRGL